MIIEHISVSRKQTWDDCQQKYRYRYHEKIIPEGPTQPHFVYGKVVHKIAEVYVEEQGKRDIFDIAEDVKSGVILTEAHNPDPPDLDANYRKKLPNHLRNLKELTDRIGFDGHLEWKFEYDLDPPHHRSVLGFIDRLVIRGDKYFILDYKTTKKGFWRKNKNTIKKDLQLRCYGRVIQKTFGAKAENINAALFYLEGANLISVKFTDDMLLAAEEELLQAYKDIESTPPEEAYGRVGDQCRFCDYKNMCPFYSLT